MECRPPLPICAEGGGGTQLLGSRGYCLAQWPGGVGPPFLTGLPACLHLIPKVPMEREGRRQWEEEEKKGEKGEVVWWK